MYKILDDKIRRLLKEVKPWMVGSKLIDGVIIPVFKDGTPDEIKAKYDEFVKLSKEEQD